MSTNTDYWKRVDTLFTRVFGAENVEVSSNLLRVFVEDEDERELAEALANMLYLEPPRDEVAHSNFLRFVEVAFDDEDEEEEDEDTEDEEESEDEEDSDDRSVNAIDEDGRSLKVLVTPDSHKFASKIYHGMLGNDDLSRYPAFMLDLDNFLSVYRNKNPEKNDGIDVASFLTTTESHPEIASFFEAAKKGKSGRSLFLSTLMGKLSSGDGEDAIAAFTSGNVEKFADAMGKIVESLLQDMPESKDDSSEGEGSDNEGES